MTRWFAKRFHRESFIPDRFVVAKRETQIDARESGKTDGKAGPITPYVAPVAHLGQVGATNQQPANHPTDITAMALNWTMIDEARNPVPLPFELIIKTMEGAELSLTIPEAPPSGSATSGGSGGTKKLKSTGGIWLTDQRVEWNIYRLGSLLISCSRHRSSSSCLMCRTRAKRLHPSTLCLCRFP